MVIDNSNMKVCMISPPTPFLEFYGFPPISLLYLSSYIKKYGYVSQIIDLNISNEIPNADIYAISATTPQFPYAKELLPKLKEINPYSVTIIGGAHATHVPDDCKDFDRIIIGDGEKALLQSLEDIENGINNHIYLGEQIEDLDSLPMPDRQCIDINNYHYNINGEISTLMMSSRGCPYSCLFCQNSSKTDKNVRFHSNQYVIKEIESIKKCGYKGIYFTDDMFTLRRNLLELKPYLENMSWQCQIRPDEKISNIQTLEKMGCYHVGIGLESGSQKILDIVNKQSKIENIPKVISECKNNNIKVHPYLILGLPSESHETIKETIEFLRMIEPDSVGISIFVPYPGTYIYNHLDQFDIKIEDTDYKKWYFRGGKEGYNCVVSTSELTSKDILKYRNDIDKEFN